MPDLKNWIDLGRKHWKEHLPERYQSLKAAGKLESSLKQAAEQTYLETTELEQTSGYQPDEAWQMVREKYLLLPAEGQSQPPPASNLLHQAMQSGQRTMPLE